MSYRMPHRHYTDIYGATTGDRVRLADTELVAEVERDHTVYGDECKFCGGKVLRDRMGQAAGISEDRALDLVPRAAPLLLAGGPEFVGDVAHERQKLTCSGRNQSNFVGAVTSPDINRAAKRSRRPGQCLLEGLARRWEGDGRYHIIHVPVKE